MAARIRISAKQLGIDKANKSIFIVVSIAAFVAAFSLYTTKSLLSQRSYQNEVIAGKTKAVKQLKANLEAKQSLVNSYQAFIDRPSNVIGGISDGIGDKDGDNAKIVLDALPSVYDFPALVTSLEKITKGNGYQVTSIEGKDDEINQQNISSANPVPIEMMFQMGVSGNFGDMRTISDILYRSIRPFQIQSIELKGSGGNKVSANIAAKTYYLPEKNLTIVTKEVK